MITNNSEVILDRAWEGQLKGIPFVEPMRPYIGKQGTVQGINHDDTVGSVFFPNQDGGFITFSLPTSVLREV